MSSAANHRDRSHRSYGRHKGAMLGAKKHAYVRSATAEPLLSRLRAMRRRPRESRAKTGPTGKGTD